jgi:hypothetical protein
VLIDYEVLSDKVGEKNWGGPLVKRQEAAKAVPPVRAVKPDAFA